MNRYIILDQDTGELIPIVDWCKLQHVRAALAQLGRPKPKYANPDADRLADDFFGRERVEVK